MFRYRAVDEADGTAMRALLEGRWRSGCGNISEDRCGKRRAVRLAQTGAARAQCGLEDDLDGLGGERPGQSGEDADLGGLLLVRDVVPPRQVLQLAHVDIRGRRLGKLVTDGAEQVEPIGDDARGVPKLSARDLEDRLARAPGTRREVPATRVGSTHPHGEVAEEGDDHRDLGGRGRELPEGRIATRYEGEIRHWGQQ